MIKLCSLASKQIQFKWPLQSIQSKSVDYYYFNKTKKKKEKNKEKVLPFRF